MSQSNCIQTAVAPLKPQQGSISIKMQCSADASFSNSCNKCQREQYHMVALSSWECVFYQSLQRICWLQIYILP
jgi:hypothetical protein